MLLQFLQTCHLDCNTFESNEDTENYYREFEVLEKIFIFLFLVFKISIFGKESCYFLDF